MPTGVELRADSAGRFAPLVPVARTSDGDLVTGSLSEVQVLRWSGDGTLEAAYLRAGEGPGELARGPLHSYVLPGDSLLIRDNRLRWTVLDPDGRFVRMQRESLVTGMTETTHILEDGRILSTFPDWPVPEDSAILVLSPSGGVVRAFGSLSPRLRARHTGQRFSSYAKGHLWVAPGDDAERGYVLEHWDTAGRLIETLTRKVSWFGKADTSLRPRGTTSFPWIRMIHVDSTGLLLVLTTTYPFGKDFDITMPAEERSKRMLAYFEVIDPASRQVLASAAGRPGDFPQAMFPGGRLGYRRVQDSLGGGVVRLLRVDLISSSDSIGQCIPGVAASGR